MADDILEEGKAVDYFIELLNEEISNQIRRLLEEKHLYQKVKVERIEELRTKALRQVAKESREWLGPLLDKELNHTLEPTSGGPVCNFSNCPLVLPHL
jgi:hypothetical protein